jgi:hypothetical protein
VSTDPIDPKYLLELPFGKMSFWVQPWRAYLDTWSNSQLLSSPGINFNVPPAQAEATAQLLQETGFKLARVSFSWNGLSYTDPTKLRPDVEASQRTRLTALHNHGLRPLFVLDANSGAPTPLKTLTLTTVQPALSGARTVVLTPESAAQVVPGKTGFNDLSFGGSPDVLISSVAPGGVATLSRPLPSPLPAGPHAGTTLLYAPFAAPTLPGGAPNPAFQATMAGWLNYVAVVCKAAESIFGPGGYDIEVWNELSFGSEFLNAEHYYPPEPGTDPEGKHKAEVTREVIRAVRSETVRFIRSPASGATPEVGITDGFASQTPFPSGATAPLGMTALSKHPYVSRRIYPTDYTISSLRPVNALGVQDTLPKATMPFVPLFIPTYEAAFPEFMIGANNTEFLIRDIAPMTTEIYGFPHGRQVGPVGGAPLQKWITEYNLDVPRGTLGMTPADKVHFHAKALLRHLVSMVGKGISRDYFFAAGQGPDSLIGESFYSALEAHPNTYPGKSQSGEILAGFHNLLTHFEGPGPTGPARQLKLLSIDQKGNHAQFTGDGTAAHPNLYDREVLAVLPFQSSPTHFVIPVYVMTRDLATLYSPTAPQTDITRYDLPEETFRITLSNLPETTTPPTVTAYDPLHNHNTPAQLITRTGNTATFELNTTDYPRLLNLEYNAHA